MKSITQNYIYNFIYQIVVLLIPIFLSPYLAQTLGPKNLGIYGYIYSVCNIISTISLIGSYNFGIRQIAYYRDNIKQFTSFFWELFLLRLILGCISLIIYFTIAYISDYFIYFILFSGWLIASIIDTSWLFIGMEDMKPTILKNFLVKISSIILIFLAVKQEEDLYIYILIMSMTMFISTSILLFQIKKYIKKITLTLKNQILHIKGSIMLFLPQVAILLYLQIGKILIETITHDIKQVAFYDMGEKIITIPLTFITVLSTVMMPRIANNYINNNKNSIKILLEKAGQISLMFAIPMCFGIAICAHNLIPWYLGIDFSPSISAIIIMSPIIIANSLIGISGNQYFTATNQIKILTYSYFSALIVNIILNYTLIKNMGFIGAAYTTTATSFTSLIIQYYFFNKQLEIKPYLYYILKYIILSIPMGSSILIYGMYSSPTYITTLIQIIGGAFIYISSLLFIKDSLFIELSKRFTQKINIRIK